jgi:hypothetical protein
MKARQTGRGKSTPQEDPPEKREEPDKKPPAKARRKKKEFSPQEKKNTNAWASSLTSQKPFPEADDEAPPEKGEGDESGRETAPSITTTMTGEGETTAQKGPDASLQQQVPSPVTSTSTSRQAPEETEPSSPTPTGPEKIEVFIDNKAAKIKAVFANGRRAEWQDSKAALPEKPTYPLFLVGATKWQKGKTGFEPAGLVVRKLAAKGGNPEKVPTGRVSISSGAPPETGSPDSPALLDPLTAQTTDPSASRKSVRPPRKKVELQVGKDGPLKGVDRNLTSFEKMRDKETDELVSKLQVHYDKHVRGSRPATTELKRAQGAYQGKLTGKVTGVVKGTISGQAEGTITGEIKGAVSGVADSGSKEMQIDATEIDATVSGSADGRLVDGKVVTDFDKKTKLDKKPLKGQFYGKINGILQGTLNGTMSGATLNGSVNGTIANGTLEGTAKGEVKGSLTATEVDGEFRGEELHEDRCEFVGNDGLPIAGAKYLQLAKAFALESPPKEQKESPSKEQKPYPFKEAKIGNTFIRCDSTADLPEDAKEVSAQLNVDKDYDYKNPKRPRRVLIACEKLIRTFYVWDPTFSSDPFAFAVAYTLLGSKPPPSEEEWGEYAETYQLDLATARREVEAQGRVEAATTEEAASSPDQDAALPTGESKSEVGEADPDGDLKRRLTGYPDLPMEFVKALQSDEYFQQEESEDAGALRYISKLLWILEGTPPGDVPPQELNQLSEQVGKISNGAVRDLLDGRVLAPMQVKFLAT